MTTSTVQPERAVRTSPAPRLPTQPDRPNGKVWVLALLGWSAVLAFYHLEGGAEFEPTDCWVSQTAREMLERGDWFMPYFSGEMRLQKSPGPYWAVMLASLWHDSGVTKGTTRIPSAIAAIVLVMTVFWLAWRIAGRREAIFAGFAAASSILFLYWSHRGASDLGLASLVAVSLAFLWVGTACEPAGRRRIAFWMVGYLAAGLGMLYKMPMPLACVGLPALVYLTVTGRWRLLWNKWHLVGIVLFLLPWLPWAIAVFWVEPTALAKWRLEYWHRFTGELPNVEEQKHWKAYLIYLIPPLVFTVPYTLSLPAALARSFRADARVNRDGMVFLLIWFFSLLAFFTASVGKEVRYFLPALPPLFVLLGIELAHFFDRRETTSIRRDRLGAIATYVLVPAAMIGGVFGLYEWCRHDGRFPWSEVWPPYAVAAAIFSTGACLSAWLYQRQSKNASFAALVGTMWCAWFWIWPQLMPLLANEAPFIEFAHQLRDKLPEEYHAGLKQIGSQDSRIIWYSDVRFPRIIDQLDLLEMQGGDKRDLRKEERIVANEMIRQLQGEEPVLFVASRPHYVRFLIEAPRQLAEEGREFPESHLWLQTSIGQRHKHFILFGNNKPPWPEPELTPPSQRLLEAVRERGETPTEQAAPTSTPSTQSSAQSEKGRAGEEPRG